MIKWFLNCKNLEELKAQYKKLVLQHHPDRGGSTQVMAQINAEYDRVFVELQKGSTNKAEQNEKVNEYREIITQLLNLSGIQIELCGAWLWISGDTRPHKEEFKKLGCRWSNPKKMWYWRPEESACYHKGKGKDMEEIRRKHGSSVIQVRKNYLTA